MPLLHDCMIEGKSHKYKGMYMAFYAIDEIFEYNGKQLQVSKVPRKFWPCQNCALYEECCMDYGRQEFPACKAKDRKDDKRGLRGVEIELVPKAEAGEPAGR